MRPYLVSLSVLALVLASERAGAQSAAQLELSGLAGLAHTDRVARLGAEEWVEPYSGARIDLRFASLGGGRAGLALVYDYYAFGVRGYVPPPCLACALSAPPDGWLPYHEHGTDERLALGATWQRLVLSWLRLDAAGFVGLRQTTHEQRVDGMRYDDAAPRRGLLAGELGLSTLVRSLVTGVALQYGTSTMAGGRQRTQNRVAIRLGYAIPLRGSRKTSD